MDLSKFRTNTTSSESGVKVDLGEGLSITVARLGNKKYNDELRRLTKPYTHAIRNKTVSDEVMEKVVLEAFVGNVLLSWEGLTLDGKKVPFSREKAIEILKDPAYIDFRTTIEALANEAETFRSADVAETVGN